MKRLDTQTDDNGLDLFCLLVVGVFFGIVGYLYGVWNANERWADWRDDLQLPSDVFYVDGVYRPEPWE